MKLKNKIISLLVAVVAVMSISIMGKEGQLTTVYINHYNYEKEFLTKEKTIKKFIESEKIFIEESDSLNYSWNKKLDGGKIYLNITEGFYANLKINGEDATIKIGRGRTIHALLNMLEESDKSEEKYFYEYLGNKHATVNEFDIYEIIKITQRTIVTVEEVEFETKIEIIDELPNELKEKLVVKGVLGKKEITTVEKLQGEKIIDTQKTEKIISNPINEVIHRTADTYIETPEGNFIYTKKITMNATAYTSGFESTGKTPSHPQYGITASGMKARRGVVAVDTRVIPFGTKLYVEGYGVSIAGDTGGAIKGNKIDVYYDDLYDAIQFGRRDLDVYILEQE